MAYSSNWETIIQDDDGYQDALQEAKRLRDQLDHENGHGEIDEQELEAHLEVVNAAIQEWETQLGM